MPQSLAKCLIAELEGRNDSFPAGGEVAGAAGVTGALVGGAVHPEGRYNCAARTTQIEVMGDIRHLSATVGVVERNVRVNVIQALKGVVPCAQRTGS